MSTKRPFNDQRGNILFLILLAVVLFAALSYAVTNSTRGGGNSASAEKMRTQVAQLMNYGALMETTMTRMRLNGVVEANIDYNDASGPSTAGANAACTSSSCRLFNSSAGEGQITSVKFDESFVDANLRANRPTFGDGSGTETTFADIPIVNVGTAEPEKLLIIKGLNASLCDEINKTISGNASHPAFSYIWPSLDGIYKGTSAGCFGRDSANVTNPYYGGDFYYVLITR